MNPRIMNMSPWTWLAASAMAGGLALLAAPAQADVANTPTSQQSSNSAVGQGSIRGILGGDDGGLGLGGFGHRRDKGDEITDLFAIFGADD